MDQVAIYIQDQPERYRLIFHQLRDLIINSSPKITEKFSYQCPFYYYKRPLCYLYTSKMKPEKLLLGLCQGAQLSNVHEVFTATERKQIRLVEIDVNKNLELDTIREIVNEAIILQDIIYD